MNWEHLRAFVWLRWRLLANGWRRAGSLNFALTMIFAVAALVSTVPVFIGSLLLGLYAFDKASPKILLYAWDVLALAFVFVWCVGLMTELQRTESLSLSRFMHLPVSLQGAFAINYVSSLLGLTTIIFVPVMVGFSLGLVFSKGVWLLAALPLLTAFLFMVTGLSYQFQGWLASLMTNPRRRRTVLVVLTTVFVLIAQLPNLLNIFAPWNGKAKRSTTLVQELDQLQRDFQAQKFDAQEHLRRQNELIEKHKREDEEAFRKNVSQWERVANVLNLALPIGWLPLGVKRAAEGNVFAPCLAFSAMTLIGAGSLWRAYLTTIRIYQGGFTVGKRRAAPSATASVAAEKPKPTTGARLLEMHLPGISEPASAIALAGFRSLLRSPEAKMMLLTPLLMSFIVGGALLRQPNGVPPLVRPLAAIGAMLMVLVGMMPLLVNQFGFDRDGFRVFVLCAASRRDILLGKNLAYLPLAGVLAMMLVAIVEFVAPLRPDHLCALLPQFISMFLLFCILANMLSIYAPMAIAAGSLKPANQKALPILIQMLAMFVFFPLTQAPTFVPLGVEAIVDQFGWRHGAPVYLLLAAVECAAAAWLYRFVLNWQGRLMQGRERRILETVTKTSC